MAAFPSRAAITGLVLAGGRGQRLGGVDKGLQPWHGRALVDHAIERLAPQVAEVMISANRNAADYASRGARVLADAHGDFRGPLAGMLAGLRAAATPWLAVVPCDSPRLPIDLVERLARGLAVMSDILDPDMIVLGGGMSNVDALYDGLTEAIGASVFSDVYTTPVVRAAHGDSSGVRGAAWLWPLDGPA